MTLTRYGIREWGGGAIIAVLLMSGAVLIGRGGFPVVPAIVCPLVTLIYIAVALFFRNPTRKIPADTDALICPADGVVKDIAVVDFDQAPFSGKALRIGIFLSVLDVHVNRASADVEITDVSYRPGRYLDARHPDCAKLNEAMTIAGYATLEGERFPMAIRQVSGAIARRIVCPVVAGRKLQKGEIYGMIKFGSRTELYLPADGFEAAVEVGQTVRGGSHILARKIKAEQKA